MINKVEKIKVWEIEFLVVTSQESLSFIEDKDLFCCFVNLSSTSDDVLFVCIYGKVGEWAKKVSFLVGKGFSNVRIVIFSQ